MAVDPRNDGCDVVSAVEILERDRNDQGKRYTLDEVAQRQRSSPRAERARRIAELAEIVDRLKRVIDPNYIPVWMMKPIEALDNNTPLEMVATDQARCVVKLIWS